MRIARVELMIYSICFFKYRIVVSFHLVKFAKWGKKLIKDAYANIA